MAPTQQIKLLECCQVSPPTGSVPSTTLPLTFLDIPWLNFSPNQPLFFYDFPHTSHFKQTILSNFKISLSLTLQYYFPLAGNLIIPPQPNKPQISYTSGDSVSLTIAESTTDFNYLSGYHQKGVQDFHQLVPQLSHISDLVPVDQESKYSLLAIQITIFPQCGVSIGFSKRHVVADERTFNNFLKTWAAIFRNGLELHLPVLNKNLPYYDRSVIYDTNGVEPILWKQWWNQQSTPKLLVDNFCDMVRSTFVMDRPEMEVIKGWIVSRSKKLFGSAQLLLSPYVVTCSFIWVCWLKANMDHDEDSIEKTEPHYFGFIAGGITRLGYLVPVNYVGNCTVFGRAMAKRNELLGENGIVFAAKAIGDTIKQLDRDVLGLAEDWIPDWKVFHGSGLHINVTGSPKVDLYTLDFGWGRPKKIEKISIDITGGVSLCESKDMIGGIEVGLALSLTKMKAFHVLYNEGLKNLHQDLFHFT